MDIDVLRVSGKTEWKRLEELTRTRTLTGEQIDELDRLYRSATTDLARVRTTSPDPDVIADLSRILSAASWALSGNGGHQRNRDCTLFQGVVALRPLSDSMGDSGRHGRLHRARSH